MSVKQNGDFHGSELMLHAYVHAYMNIHKSFFGLYKLGKQGSIYHVIYGAYKNWWAPVIGQLVDTSIAILG